MARARNIKPGFFKDYELADGGMAAQLLYIGLWCLADKEGMLLDRPRYIKAEIFPYYDVDVNGELTVIERLGNIRRYEKDNIKVIELVNFKKHQAPHHTEKKSEIPKFTEEEYISYCKSKEKKITVNSPLDNGGNPPDSLIPDSLIPDSLIPDSLIPDSLIPENSSCEELSASTKNEAHKKHKEPSELDLLKDLGVEDQIAKDFLTVRKKKRLPLTVTAMSGIVEEAEKAGVSVSDAIAISTKKGWGGFDSSWDWPGKQKTNGSQAPPFAKYTMPKIDYGEYEPSEDKFGSMKIIEGERVG